MALITSRANPKIKLIRSLHDRRRRDRTRLFLVEGLQLLEAALDAGAEVVLLAVVPQVLSADGEAAVDRAREQTGADVLEVAPDLLASISPRHCHQGVVAVARQRFSALDYLSAPPDDCFVAVKEITEPWSVGNILRTSDAVGGRGLILIGDSTDPYHPTAVRSSLGALFSQALVRASFADLAAWKRHRGWLAVGTSPGAATDYREAVYRGPVVLLMGSERVGLSAEEQAICDTMVAIPMNGRCESHHVVVATALVLYEIARQRQSQAACGTTAKGVAEVAGTLSPDSVW
jgi:TrmH family RNA methyltransferase